MCVDVQPYTDHAGYNDQLKILEIRQILRCETGTNVHDRQMRMHTGQTSSYMAAKPSHKARSWKGW